MKERKYKDTKTIKFKNGRTMEQTKIRKGLKIVHIGKDVWKIGRNSIVTDPNDATKEIKHQIIYGPGRKEYHVYGSDVDLLHKEYTHDFYSLGYDRESFGSNVNKHGNKTIEGAVKIYILTTILDDKKNWNFDLNVIPEIGKLKVIYDNGTVKNIDFNGTFENIKQLDRIYKIMYPVGYRVS